jgi:hypothetical protein
LTVLAPGFKLCQGEEWSPLSSRRRLEALAEQKNSDVMRRCDTWIVLLMFALSEFWSGLAR